MLLALVAPATHAAADTTSAQRQPAWVLAISQHPPAPEAEVREHLTTEMLDAVGGPQGFAELLTNVGPLRATRTVDSAADAVAAVADEWLLVAVHTDTAARTDGPRFRPYATSPAI